MKANVDWMVSDGSGSGGSPGGGSDGGIEDLASGRVSDGKKIDGQRVAAGNSGNPQYSSFYQSFILVSL